MDRIEKRYDAKKQLIQANKNLLKAKKSLKRFKKRLAEMKTDLKKLNGKDLEKRILDIEKAEIRVERAKSKVLRARSEKIDKIENKLLYGVIINQCKNWPDKSSYWVTLLLFVMIGILLNFTNTDIHKNMYFYEFFCYQVILTFILHVSVKSWHSLSRKRATIIRTAEETKFVHSDNFDVLEARYPNHYISIIITALFALGITILMLATKHNKFPLYITCYAGVFCFFTMFSATFAGISFVSMVVTIRKVTQLRTDQYNDKYPIATPIFDVIKTSLSAGLMYFWAVCLLMIFMALSHFYVLDLTPPPKSNLGTVNLEIAGIEIAGLESLCGNEKAGSLILDANELKNADITHIKLSMDNPEAGNFHIDNLKADNGKTVAFGIEKIDDINIKITGFDGDQEETDPNDTSLRHNGLQEIFGRYLSISLRILNGVREGFIMKLYDYNATVNLGVDSFIIWFILSVIMIIGSLFFSLYPYQLLRAKVLSLKMNSINSITCLPEKSKEYTEMVTYIDGSPNWHKGTFFLSTVPIIISLLVAIIQLINVSFH